MRMWHLTFSDEGAHVLQNTSFKPKLMQSIMKKAQTASLVVQMRSSALTRSPTSAVGTIDLSWVDLNNLQIGEIAIPASYFWR